MLISSGKFHAISLALETGKQVYVLEGNTLQEISKKEIENLKRKQKASYINYLNSKKVGILISTKPGQQNLKKALELKKKIKDKQIYFFISNNIDISEFENFEIDSYINTACPRIDMNSNKV